MIVFGQMEARTKTNNYQAPFDQGFSKTISSELQKEAIGSSIVTRYFQNVLCKFSISQLQFLPHAKRVLMEASTKRNDQSLTAIFNPPIFYLKQKLGSFDNNFCCLFVPHQQTDASTKSEFWYNSNIVECKRSID